MSPENKLSPSPHRRAMMAHPESHFSSPVRSREEKRRHVQEDLRKKREEASLRARGGMQGMENDYLRAQYHETVANLQRESAKYSAVPEEQEKEWKTIQDDSDYLDAMICLEEKELEYLTDMIPDASNRIDQS
jgi:hypothetical protein